MGSCSLFLDTHATGIQRMSGMEDGLVLSGNIEPIVYHPEILGHDVDNRQQFRPQCKRRMRTMPCRREGTTPTPSSCARMPVGDARSTCIDALLHLFGVCGEQSVDMGP